MGLISTKFGAHRHSAPPLKSIGVATKQVTSKKAKDGASKHDLQSSSTRLTSTYVEARHVSDRSLSWLPFFVSKPAAPIKRWASKLWQRRGSKRLIAIILATIIVFAPSFSPANAATTATAMTSAARGLAPVMPYSSQSRALGTFNFLPTKAELELCFRLIYATCLGSFVGLERSTADRPAGVRTMALVGLGACTFSICSTHGFLPHSALGYAPGSPLLDNVKVDLSRMAANVASGVGFIGAGAIHKSKLHGNGTDSQNVVAGLTTAAAIWVSAAVGIASAVGLYFVGAVTAFSTVGILKYARLGKEEPEFSWEPRPLDVVDSQDTQQEQTPQEVSPPANHDATFGLFGKCVVSDYDPHIQAFVDQEIAADLHPIIMTEVIQPTLERYHHKRLASECTIIGQ